MNQPERVGCETADHIVKSWPQTAREAANEMMDKCGAPDEASSGLLIWHNNGPWRRSIVYSEEAKHYFPTPHRDVLEKFIPYRVPVERFDDLVAFDGSFLVDRTKGLPLATHGGSRVRENRTHESLRGAPSNGRPYRDPKAMRSQSLRYMGAAVCHTLLWPAGEESRAHPEGVSAQFHSARLILSDDGA